MACGDPRYRYGLLNFDLSINPDYWSFVLFKRLVGTSVLQTSTSSTGNSTDTLRSYSYCSRSSGDTGSSAGGIVVTLLNLSNDTTTTVNVTAASAHASDR